MATAGPRYPGTVASEIGPSGDNDWLTATNISADDGSEAQITAATYDAGDQSYRLKATNFGFSADFSAGATINGITVEIDRRCFAGAASDFEVRLYDSTATLVGDDKATATAWPATLTVATYGGAADTWTASLDATDIRHANFGVALIVDADGANTDIGVDFIRVTIDYTSNDKLVTPGVASLTTVRFTPTVTATNNVLLTPGAASLTTTRFTPTVLTPRLVTPGLATLALNAFAPSAVTDTKSTPGIATLTLTPFTPTVTVGAGGGGVTATPGVATLSLTAFAPTVLSPRLVTPGLATLALTAFAPTATASGAPVVGGPAPRGTAGAIVAGGSAGAAVPRGKATVA